VSAAAAVVFDAVVVAGIVDGVVFSMSVL